MKDKKSITITNAFQEILDESNRKPNKIWVDKGNEICNRSMKSWLEKNAIEMHSVHNEEKFVIAERFIRTLKNKTYKYITSRSKNVYIRKLDNILTKYNSAYHRTIKMKPVDVKRNIYIDLRKKITRKVLNLMLAKMLEHENIKVYKNKNIYENIFFEKAMLQIGLMKCF